MYNEPESSMPPISSIASSSRLSTLKNFAHQRSFFSGRTMRPGEPGTFEGDQAKQSWREWAGGKIRRRGSSMNELAVEKVSLFPGWASRRYHNKELEGKEAAEFSLEVYVSGFAASYVPPESATRSQKAFMRLAKAFAALPKMVSEEMSTLKLSSSTEELLKRANLPPTPSEITEESEIMALEKQFRHADPETESVSSTDSDSPPSLASNSVSGSSTPQVSYACANPQFSRDPTDLVRLHTNLNERLQPFWSRAIPNRKIRLSIYSIAPQTSQFFPDECEDEPERAPIFVHETSTNSQGSFETKVRVPWERICVHPGALHIAFGEPHEEYELYVTAELLPALNPTLVVIPSYDTAAKAVLAIPITHSEIRLISDVDDTIKLSNILGGARAVFRNVFVKHLEELVIKGMGEWYSDLFSRGVRFHYVSNGPFELLPVINEFIKVSNLPRGSVRLRSYAGRSLFNGLLSAPATRKRDGILDILSTFSSSRFFLVGDTGEQDLELYAQIAAEHHGQILAVFVRDASTGSPDALPLDDPTGEEIKHHPPTFQRAQSFAAGTQVVGLGAPKLGMGAGAGGPTPTQGDYMQTPMNATRNSRLPYIDTSTHDYLTAKPSSSSPRNIRPPARSPSDPTPTTPGIGISSTFFDSGFPLSETPGDSPTTPSDVRPPGSLQFPGSLTKSEIANLPPAKRKRYVLQERVYRARLMIPSHIPLRIFTQPEECVEASQVLDSLKQQRCSRP